jgi:hypothetical protein
MDALVDIFYYDFLLSKVIELYHHRASIDCIIPYLKIATVMSKKFRDDKIPMDTQVYLKEIYVKIIQYVTHYIGSKNESLDPKSSCKLIDCIRSAVVEMPDLSTDQEFLKLVVTAFAIFSKVQNQKIDIQKIKDSKENTEKSYLNGIGGNVNFTQNIQYVNFITESLKDFSFDLINQYTELINKFQSCNLIDYLKTIQLGNPVMKKFSIFIKDKIDNERDENITNRKSPGEKIKW